MDVTETERLWALGLLLQDGGEDRGFIKDDIPEELVSMEWTEEHDEEDSESWKSEHTREEHGAVRAEADSAFRSFQSTVVETDTLVPSTAAHCALVSCLWYKRHQSRCQSVTQCLT